MDPLGLRVMPSQKYSKKCLAFCLSFDRNTAWTGFLTKYSEFDLSKCCKTWSCRVCHWYPHLGYENKACTLVGRCASFSRMKWWSLLLANETGESILRKWRSTNNSKSGPWPCNARYLQLTLTKGFLEASKKRVLAGEAVYWSINQSSLGDQWGYTAWRYSSRGRKKRNIIRN